MSIWTTSIIKRGATYEILIALTLATLFAGYLFFLDISDEIWWTKDQIWWRGWDYLSTKPMRHTVRVDEVTSVSTANHPANMMPGKPFDRILIRGASDAITILPSFHRREELEELLRHINAQRPDVFVDPLVTDFMNGGFADWWRYR